jgi:hypothetical protein
MDSHTASDGWNPTVGALADGIERAIRDAVGTRSLAALIDADVRTEAAEAAAAEASRRRPA